MSGAGEVGRTATALIDDACVREVFDWKAAVAALREAYLAGDSAERYPARGMARGDHGWLRTLSGAPAGERLMGAKLIAAGLTTRDVSYLTALFDQTNGVLVALLDAHSITGFRTAATSALAADTLTPAGPVRVGVIGSGFEAANHLQALAAIRELNGASVFSPRESSRERFVAQAAEHGIEVTPMASAREVVDASDIVVCAARSRDESPTLEGAWLRPGMTVVSIGSTLPEQREVDPDTLARADVVIADMLDEVLHDTGDLLAARAAGIDVEERAASLGDLIAGRHAGRTAPKQIALYKSVGSATQDLAIAEMCWRRARDAGRLTQHADFVTPVPK